MTVHCAKAVIGQGEAYKAAWEAMVAQCKLEGKAANVENLLSKVRVKLEQSGRENSL